MPAAGQTLVHASAVAVGPNGLLILGESGTGKSSLAISLVALGADLVADDQVLLHRKEGGLLMSAPPGLQNRIEARGVGILQLQTGPAWARAVVDLNHVEADRLPHPKETVIAGETLRTLHRVESAAFPSMIYLLLHEGIA